MRQFVAVLALLCLTLPTYTHAQHYSEGAVRLGIIGGVNIGGEEATLKYASYTPHPFGMTTMEYFLLDRMALTGSLFAGTLAATLNGRTLFPAYGKQPITGYDTKYYGLSTGIDYALPTLWHITPLAKGRLGALMHHTRVDGSEGFSKRMSKSAWVFGIGGGLEYPMARELSLFLSYDLVLSDSDELDGLRSGKRNDALSVITVGLTWLLRPGDKPDEPAPAIEQARPRGGRRDIASRTRSQQGGSTDAGAREAGSQGEGSVEDGMENADEAPPAEAPYDPVRGGLVIEQTPDPQRRAMAATQETQGSVDTPPSAGDTRRDAAAPVAPAVLRLSTSLTLTPLRRFSELERNPELFTLTVRQTGKERMELKNYVEILRDGRSLYQGNSDLTLTSREQRYTASEFLNLPEMLERTQGDAPLSKGNYVVRISTVAWDYELSSLSQAKFLNMDLRPIFGPQSDEAKRLITGKAVDVTVEKQDGLLVNFFDVAQNVASERAPKPGSDAARDAVLLSPRGSTQSESERYLSDGVQRSFQEALRLQNLAASHGKPERLKVVVTEVYFPLDEDRLVAESQTLLDNVARHLNQHPELFAEIRGFAADVGDESSNAALARKRAQRVIEYLGRQKIASYRMQLSEQEDVVAPVRPGEDARTGRKVEIALVRKGM